MPSLSVLSEPEGAELHIDGKEIHCTCIFRPIVDTITQASSKAGEHLINSITLVGVYDLKNGDATEVKLQDVLRNPTEFLFAFGHGLPNTIEDDNWKSIRYSDIDLTDKIVVISACESGRGFCKDAVITGSAKAAIGHTRPLGSTLSGNEYNAGFKECFTAAQKSIVSSIQSGTTDIKTIIETAYSDTVAEYNKWIKYYEDMNAGTEPNLLAYDRNSLTYYTNAGVQTTININTDPSGAEVFMDGYGYAGLTPIENMSVRSEGNFISSIRAPNYSGRYKTIIVPDLGGTFDVPLIKNWRPVDWITDTVWIERQDMSYSIGYEQALAYHSRFAVCGGESPRGREAVPCYMWYFMNNASSSVGSVILSPSISGGPYALEELDPQSFAIPAHGTVPVMVMDHGEDRVGSILDMEIKIDGVAYTLSVLMTANIYFKNVDIYEDKAELEWNNIPDAAIYWATCEPNLGDCTTKETSCTIKGEMADCEFASVDALDADMNLLTHAVRDVGK